MAGLTTIDKHPERQKIIDMILAGQSMDKVAKFAGVTRQSVWNYKKRVVIPAAELIIHKQQNASRTAKSRQINGMLDARESLDKATKSITLQSPVTDRLETLWDHTISGITEAKNAVKTVRDKQGNEVPVGRDLAVLAPLLAQAHRNVELLGNLTGEFNQQTQAVTNIQVVVMPVKHLSNDVNLDNDVIDITPA